MNGFSWVFREASSNHNPFDLIKADVVVGGRRGPLFARSRGWPFAAQFPACRHCVDIAGSTTTTLIQVRILDPR